MRRREFIALLSGAAAWPLAARAQQPGRVYRLGILHNQGRQSLQFPPFYDELRRFGFVEGQNLLVDGRGYAVRTEEFPAVAAELAKAQVDAIVAGGADTARPRLRGDRITPACANQFAASAHVGFCAGFRTPVALTSPHAPLAGARKAPRQYSMRHREALGKREK